jgi:hypothetical protein
LYNFFVGLDKSKLKVLLSNHSPLHLYSGIRTLIHTIPLYQYRWA